MGWLRRLLLIQRKEGFNVTVKELIKLLEVANQEAEIQIKDIENGDDLNIVSVAERSEKILALGKDPLVRNYVCIECRM